jgi:hypothetical protein
MKRLALAAAAAALLAAPSAHAVPVHASWGSSGVNLILRGVTHSNGYSGFLSFPGQGHAYGLYKPHGGQSFFGRGNGHGNGWGWGHSRPIVFPYRPPTVTPTPVAATPEPAAALVFGVGLLAARWAARRRA